MGNLRLDNLLDYLTGGGLLFGLLWLGLAALTVALLLLMRTRWGQSRPLGKCLALSLLAHVLLAGYATTIRIVASSSNVADEKYVSFSMDEDTLDRPRKTDDPAYDAKPWQAMVDDHMTPPAPIDLERPELEATIQSQRHALVEDEGLTADPAMDQLALAEAIEPVPEKTPESSVPVHKPAEAESDSIEAPAAQRRDSPAPLVPLQPEPGRAPAIAETETAVRHEREPALPSSLFAPPTLPPRLTDAPPTPRPDGTLPPLAGAEKRPAEIEQDQASTGQSTSAGAASSGELRMVPPALTPVGDRYEPGQGMAGAAAGLASIVGPPRLPTRRGGEEPSNAPEIYRLRTAPDRAKLAEQRGATSDSEKAVKAALKWLAANQEADGRWNARRHGAGRELMVALRDRKGAGSGADTGVTGLAILAFQAAGNTHLKGEYQDNVRRGLEYLIRSQGSDGNLGGEASMFAFMYCHAMASFALSEAYAVTEDARLREPVRRAVLYTLAAQDPSSGGWRYKPRDPGDTSQLGWQFMALKSAELGGIRMPQQTRLGIERFLRSVSSGTHGGVAAYRPGESPSRSMTAEALVCRQFLGAAPNDAACREAGDYLLAELPGQGKEANLYYWYYGTLAMYQLQGTHWQQWNDAVQTVLIARQEKDGPMAGSWSPDTLWAGYGGRVYSTAMATLCLEVYYRYLPLFVEVGPAAEVVR